MTSSVVDGSLTRFRELTERLNQMEAREVARLEELAALQQQLALRTESAVQTPQLPPTQISAKHLRPQAIGRFSGSREEAKAWVDLVDDRLEADGDMHTLTGLNYAVSYLVGSASEWWLCYKHDHPEVRSWAGARAAFLREYQMVNEQAILERRLITMVQTGAFGDYVDKFRATARRLTDQSDAFKQRRFLFGSNAFLRNRFAGRTFPDLTELVTEALLVESLVDPGSFSPDAENVPVVAAIAVNQYKSGSRSKGKPKGQLICYGCGKPGHKEADCRAKPEASSTRAQQGSRTTGHPVKGKARFGKYNGSGRVNAVEVCSESDDEEVDDDDLRDGEGNGQA